MPTPEAWSRYARWCAALAEVLFPEREDVQAVYLDLEDEVLVQLGQALGLDGGPDEIQDDLVNTVSATLFRCCTPSELFAKHTSQVTVWARSGQTDEHPPHLPLLAAYSLAAERMAAADGMNANNYYGRLAPLLGLEDRAEVVKTAYRRVAESHWTTLNRWLEDQEGRRGLPTAYTLSADSHRYVSLAVSQALVRAADRVRLHRFFAMSGFPPRTEIQADTLVPGLDAWITQSPSPASVSMQRLWRKPASRERISEAASILLSSWDGVTKSEDGACATTSGQLRLACTVGGFLAKRFETRVMAYLPAAQQERPLEVLSVDQTFEVQALPTGAGPLVLAGSETLDPDALFDSLVRCRDTLSGAMVERQPRRVVPLRRDDLLQQHVEIDQAVLGEDLMLIVEKSVLETVTKVLEASARPGWSCAPEGLAGLPSRYVVLQNVQLLMSPVGVDHLDLRPLVPVSRSQMVVSGGFAIPGRVRRWSVDSPPEVRVIDEQATRLRLSLLGSEGEGGEVGERTLSSWSSEEPLLVVDLAAEGLDEGDYELVVHRDGEKKPTARASLRLRSGDEPDGLTWSRMEDLSHAVGDPLAAVSAFPATAGKAVAGAYVPEPDDATSAPAAAPSEHWWEVASPISPQGDRTTPWRLASPDPSSCVFTGAHTLVFPTVMPNKTTKKFIEGRCQKCGIVKRGATTNKGAQKHDQNVDPLPPPSVEVADVAPVPEPADGGWDTALDALHHMGGGAWSLLERVALQVEASNLFVDSFARHLELLGHIEVARDPRTWQPTAWGVSPTVLAGRSDGTWGLQGYWSWSLRADLRSALHSSGGDLSCSGGAGAPTAWTVTGLSPEALGLVEELGATVVPDAALRLAQHLPRLTDVVDALHVRSADVVGEIKRFACLGPRWEPRKDLEAPGAYRVHRHSWFDLLRTEADIVAGTARVSTVYLSKHAAALRTGHPLLAYDVQRCELTVPLGSDLPGLYGRAAVLASGRVPTKQGRRLVYGEVPPDVAALIAERIST